MRGATVSRLLGSMISLVTGKAAIDARLRTSREAAPIHVAIGRRFEEHSNGKVVQVTRVFDTRWAKPKERRKGKPWRHNEGTNLMKRFLVFKAEQEAYDRGG